MEYITDEALKSARGRHKSYGVRRQGQPTVWKEHNDLVPRCRCARCLLSYLSNIEGALNERVGAEIARTGVEPAWATQSRRDLRERRGAIERAILERLGVVRAAAGRT